MFFSYLPESQIFYLFKQILSSFFSSIVKLLLLWTYNGIKLEAMFCLTYGLLVGHFIFIYMYIVIIVRKLVSIK